MIELFRQSDAESKRRIISYIELLEVQIEFLKASDAEKWLEALILRHTERVRQITDDLFVMAEIKEVNA